MNITWTVVGGEIPVVSLVPTKTHFRSADAELLLWLVPLRIVLTVKAMLPDCLRPELFCGRTGRMYLNGLPAPRKAFSP